MYELNEPFVRPKNNENTKFHNSDCWIQGLAKLSGDFSVYTFPNTIDFILQINFVFTNRRLACVGNCWKCLRSWNTGKFVSNQIGWFVACTYILRKFSWILCIWSDFDLLQNCEMSIVAGKKKYNFTEATPSIAHKHVTSAPSRHCWSPGGAEVVGSGENALEIGSRFTTLFICFSCWFET